MKKDKCYEGSMQSYRRRRNPYKMAFRIIFKTGQKLFHAGIAIALLVWLFKLL